MACNKCFWLHRSCLAAHWGYKVSRSYIYLDRSRAVYGRGSETGARRFVIVSYSFNTHVDLYYNMFYKTEPS